MGNSTPSKRRREGREAFSPGMDPKDACPYDPTSWYYQFHYPDFLAGWEQAEAEFEASQADEEEEELTPCCAFCWKLKDKVDELEEELKDLRMDFETHTGAFNPDDI